MEPQFIRGATGSLFIMYRAAAGGEARGVVLIVPPFAEELNKSRRMLALAARALNARGYATVLPDVHGTGDSAGDFGEADWTGWLDDLATTLAWLRQRHTAPLHILALRAGALLASDLLARESLRPESLVLWNPVLQGQQALTQFLRLSVAGNLAGGGGETTAVLRQRLEAGESLEIAGYTLPPRVASGLDAAVLAPAPESLPRRLLWLEVSTRDEPALSPASQRAIPAWEAAGVAVTSEAVRGDAFWNTAELVDAPALVAATEAAF